MAQKILFLPQICQTHSSPKDLCIYISPLPLKCTSTSYLLRPLLKCHLFRPSLITQLKTVAPRFHHSFYLAFNSEHSSMTLVYVFTFIVSPLPLSWKPFKGKDFVVYTAASPPSRIVQAQHVVGTY